MGMTIEDARYCLENGGFCSASCKYFSVGDPNCEDNVRKIAIETMRKYQMIEKIAEKANLKLLPKEGMSTFQKEILDVLESGGRIKVANKLRASGQIQDKDRYITISETKRQMVAMLTEIQLEIEELDVSDVVPEYQDGAEETKEYIANMIEEKINSLKENT